MHLPICTRSTQVAKALCAYKPTLFVVVLGHLAKAGIHSRKRIMNHKSNPLPIATSPAIQAVIAGKTPPPCYPPMELQEFIITNGFIDRNLKVFTSEKSMRMYKEYTRLSKWSPDFARAKSAQNASTALPLLITKRSLGFGFGDNTYLRFFEALPSPEAEDRLYSKVDNRHIGVVLRRNFFGYTRYRLQLKGVETVIFAHLRLPIVDLRINDERFRFVKSNNPVLSPDLFLYYLYLLTPEQASLVDQMDSSLKVHKKNALLGGFHNMFLLRWYLSDRSKFTSPHKCGLLEFYRSWQLFTRTRKCSAFSMYTYAVGNQDANDAVEFRLLILVATSLLLQSIEDDLHLARTSSKPTSSPSTPKPTH